MTSNELLALVDDALTVRADGHRYPTLDEYGAALAELRRRETPTSVARTAMAVTQPAWKVGDPSPASGGEMVRYRPATKEEWAAYTHRETPRTLPARVDNATPDQVAELGELWVDERTGYKARVKADEHADQTRGREAREREERGTGGGAGERAGGAATDGGGEPVAAVPRETDKDAELARLRADNERLRGHVGGQG